MLEYYKNLPDYMSVDELKKLFNNFKSNVEDNEYDVGEVLESLLELADRQWHTYELLDNDIRDEIENWLLSINDIDSEDVIEYITLIVGRLGLVKLYETIKDALSVNLKKEVRQIIIETVKEMDGHVENPFYGMK